MPEPFGVASPALCCLEWVSGVAFHAYELVEHPCLCFRETGHDGKMTFIYKHLDIDSGTAKVRKAIIEKKRGYVYAQHMRIWY